MKHILFVCTGNTCRSPMAEGIFRKMLEARGMDVEVRSAGVSAAPGFPISGNALIILQEKGIDGDFSSDELNESTVAWADLILAMTMNHKRALIQRFPGAVDKVFTLREYVEDDPRVLDLIAEREKLYTEWQIQLALSQDMPERDKARLGELEKHMPDYDIFDPFGGPLDLYQQCADEIEQALAKLIRKLDMPRRK